MSNLASEQIRPDLSMEIAPDQVLTPKQQEEILKKYLGSEYCKIQDILGKKVLVYTNNQKHHILLHRAISYLGGSGQHPIFKKRVQLPYWFKEFCLEIERQKLPYDVHFMGVYHYNGLIVFVDFEKDTYLKKKVHNSSAHVYINDLYQAITTGVFHKVDMYGNNIYSIRGCHLSRYLDGTNIGQNILYSLFEQFNKDFTFGQWLEVLPTVKEMYANKWPEWKQTEWPGWYLEFKFYKFTHEHQTTPFIIYTGQSNKSKGEGIFDFDIWFQHHQFYGDLKASDISAHEAPGNDQASFLDCINIYGKFWYIIYEHETIKDSQENGFQKVRAYNHYIQEADPKIHKDELSYASRLKTGVRFLKMTILELNRINYHNALAAFNQGHQPDGSKRNPKFMIKKKDMDQFAVFRYNFPNP